VAEPEQFTVDAPVALCRVVGAIANTRVRMTWAVRGRPGGRCGKVHRRASSRECQRSSVRGETVNASRRGFGRSLASALITARSAHDRRGRLVVRWSTAIWWRRIAILASLAASERASGGEQMYFVAMARSLDRI